MQVITTTELVKFAELENLIDQGVSSVINEAEYTALRAKFNKTIYGCPANIFLAMHALKANAGWGISIDKEYRQLRRSKLWKQWMAAREERKPSTPVESIIKPFPNGHEEEEVQWFALYH